MSFCLRVMRFPALSLLLLSHLTANTQTLSPVAASVAQMHASGIPFPEIVLFSKTPQVDPQARAFAPTAQLLQLNADALSKLYRERPATVRLRLPYHNAHFILELIRVEPLMPEFRVQTNTGESLQTLSAGLHYRGIMRGDDSGLATVSIFENEIYGLISDSRRSGNLVLGAINEDLYILYADEQTTTDNPFSCETREEEMILPDLEEMPESTGGCVRVYWEVNHLLFQHKGSLQQTYNYITAIFNQMAGLYANESVDVYLSHLFVWVTPDPYSISNSATALSQFRQLRTPFDTDLAHLIAISPQNPGSIAEVDALSFNNPAYAYSSIQPTYHNLPVYSWTVEVVTHETGHNLGANHTQWCGWPGGAIDNCRPPEGNCVPGLPPVDGGTIMSDCHRTPAGINFSHGFGLLPGNLIRNRTRQANCLSAGTVAVNSATKWQLFPNPVEAWLTLKTDVPLQENQEVFIFNLLGQIKLRQEIPAGAQAIQIDIRTLPAGSYWLRLPQNNAAYTLIKI